jgi:hypothetical protein
MLTSIFLHVPLTIWLGQNPKNHFRVHFLGDHVVQKAVRRIKLYCRCQTKEKLSVLHQMSYPRSRESARLLLPSSELGPPTPLTRKAVFPVWVQGGDALALGQRVGGGPNSDEGILGDTIRTL